MTLVVRLALLRHSIQTLSREYLLTTLKASIGNFLLHPVALGALLHILVFMKKLAVYEFGVSSLHHAHSNPLSQHICHLTKPDTP